MEPRFIVAAFQPIAATLNRRTTSPNLYDNCLVTKYNCVVNSQTYPEIQDTISLPNRQITNPSNNAEKFSSKYHDISPAYSKSFINRDTFISKYPFFTFDFRAMEQSYKNANSQYELNFDLTVAAAGQICKILVIEAATIQLTQGG